jgi:hypothetical protein
MEVRSVKNTLKILPAAALATGVLFSFSSAAFAQGTVAKQSKCRLLLEGVSESTAGGTATITLSDGNTVRAKIINFKGQRAIAEIEGGKCDVNALGGSVGTSGLNKPNTVAKPRGKKGLGLGVAVEGGWGIMTIDKAIGDQNSMAHAGPEVIGTIRYAHSINSKFLVSVLAGGGWHQKEVLVNSLQTDNTSFQFEINTVSAFARMGAGGIFAMTPNLRLGGYGIFDYGFSGKYEQIFPEMNGIVSPSYPITSFMRYGTQLEFDYNVVSGLWVGAGGSLFLGSTTLGDNANSDTTTDEEKGPFGTMTYGGVFKLSYEI